MSSKRPTVTAVEFGSDKICVLQGRQDSAGNAEVLAFAEAPSAGAVQKGLIVDTNKASKILGDVLDTLDHSGYGERTAVYYQITGSPVQSRQGEGTVIIQDSNRIGREHVMEALEKAHNIALQPGIVSFASFDAFFLLDHARRIKSPIGEFANQLDAYVHIMTTGQKRLDMFRHILRENDFDQDITPVFSGIASAFSVLTVAEREQGVLLLDFGYGVCDYALIYEDGVYDSGVLPVGVANVANDLSIGLELPYELCLKFLQERQLGKLRSAGTHIFEYASGTGKKRYIPLDSFEKIIQLRLRETFGIIESNIRARSLASSMASGAVLCGGGALIEGAVDCMKSVFSAPVRLGKFIGITGSTADFGETPVRYASLLGLFRYALEAAAQRQEESSNQVFGVITGIADFFVERIKKIGDFQKK